jgi:hypothetical protein
MAYYSIGAENPDQSGSIYGARKQSKPTHPHTHTHTHTHTERKREREREREREKGEREMGAFQRQWRQLKQIFHGPS